MDTELIKSIAEGVNNAIVTSTKPLKEQIDQLQAEVERLEKENNHLLDTCFAACYIGKGTQIIGDKRYKELVKAEAKVKRLEKLLRKHNICPSCGKQLTQAEVDSVHTCRRGED